MRLFARVARRGSFSAAGRELSVPQSTASRMIAALEREIGASLLIRTTRAVTLTDTGANFLARIEPILADLDAAEHAARGSDELRGLLRVGLGTSLGVRLVIPRLKPFLDRHPALQVELMLDDHRRDLVTEGVDVAFRFGTLTDSTATVRKLKTWPRALVASPTYLKSAPALDTPADLAAHSVIVGPQGVSDWSFRKGGTATSVRIEGRLKIPALEGALTAAAAGMGVVMATAGAIRRELADGSLVQVLPDWDMGSVDMHALFTAGRAAKPSARAIAAYLSEALADA
ncbi:MAG TPA: LysR family transcriptional regulator [Acetobacteraceae bacterium]|nr:LysR family transcriptional regulator [Acetobacteraceae bacterium]